MPEALELDANTVLGRLWDALEPLHAKVAAAGGGARVLYAVQRNPLAVHIIKVAERDLQPRSIALADPVAFTDDDGFALAEAVDFFVAAFMATQKPEVGAAVVIGDEVVPDGGLVVIVDPVSGHASLRHATPGTPLGQSVELLSLGENVTAH